MSRRRDLFLENTRPYGFIAEVLISADQEMIELKSTNATGSQINRYEEGLVFYKAHFYREEEKLPYLSSYEALLRSVPPIEHGTIASIDTQALEQKMAAVNWFKAGPGYDRLPQDAIQQLQEIWQVMEQLKVASVKGGDIVQALQMKYWAGSGAEHYACLDMKTDRYDRRYDFYVRQQHSGINIRQAYNLLCGRAILRTMGSEEGGPYWFQLKPFSSPNRYEHFEEHRYPDFSLTEKLSILPLKELLTEESTRALISSLWAGEKVDAAIETKEGEIPVKLTVDAQAQAVSIQQAGRAPEIIRTIDFNWEKYNKQSQSQVARNQVQSKRKRRGL